MKNKFSVALMALMIAPRTIIGIVQRMTRLSWVIGLATTLIGLAINAAYFVLQWSSGARATLGMRLLSLQVGNAADGTTLTREEKDALVEYLKTL